MNLGVLASVQEAWAWMQATGWGKLGRLGLVLATCFGLLYGVRLVARAVRRAVDDGDDNTTSDAERRAETLGSVLMNSARILAIGFFLVMSLKEFGVDIGPLIAGAGIAGLAVGFGAQSLVKDVISGFFLLMENQFGVGDIVNVDDKHVGTVERMTLRITQLRDGEGRAHYIPNGSIVRVVVLSKQFARAQVEVEVGYGSDIQQVFELLKGIGVDLHAEWNDRVLEPLEVLGVERLGESGITIRTLTKVAPGRQWEVARELRYRILMTFREQGIEIPSPQRTVWMREGVRGV